MILDQMIQITICRKGASKLNLNAAGVGNSRGSQKRSSMEETSKKKVIFFNFKLLFFQIKVRQIKIDRICSWY